MVIRLFFGLNLSLHKSLHFRWPEWITLGLYAILVISLIPRHEPWADEAQAWQLAKSLPLSTLFHKYLRYEGSPGLWHLLLWILARLHFSYAGMHWVCGALGLFSSALLVFRAPFPRLIRLMLPFTYFLAFQYVLVARSYTLFPPLLFLLAMIWEERRTRPILVAILLGLIANVALHVATISLGLAGVYTLEWWRERGTNRQNWARLRAMILAAGLLMVLYLTLLWSAKPPADLWYMNRTATAPTDIHNNLSEPRLKVIRGLRTTVIDDHPIERIVVFSIGALVWGIVQPFILGVPFWLAVWWRLFRQSRLLYLIPMALFASFSAFVLLSFWHAGLLFIYVIGMLWMTWPDSGTSTGNLSIRHAAFYIMFFYAILLQIGWALFAVRYDWTHPYSPDSATARFLRINLDQRTGVAVASFGGSAIGSYHSVGIEPYFDRSLFVNQPNAFWIWSNQNRTEQRFRELLPSHPRFIMVEYVARESYQTQFDLLSPSIRAIEEQGYRHTHTFCGGRPRQFEVDVYNCHLIFER